MFSIELSAKLCDSSPSNCVACIAVCDGHNQRVQIFSIQLHTLLTVGLSVFATTIWTVQVFICSVMVGLESSKLQVSFVLHHCWLRCSPPLQKTSNPKP